MTPSADDEHNWVPTWADRSRSSHTPSPDAPSLPWVRPDPMPYPITTDRLILSPLQESDIVDINVVADRFRAELGTWLTWAREGHRSLEASKRELAELLAATSDPNADSLLVVIRERTTGELIGGTGYHLMRRDDASVETGYWSRPDRWRRGYTREAVAAHISTLLKPQAHHGFGVRRVHLQCDVNNIGSVAVARSLGLRLEARHRAWSPRLDTASDNDTLVFAILADEWDHDAKRARPDIRSHTIHDAP